jgi:hypothetical protein
MMETQAQRHFVMQKTVMIGQTGGEQCANKFEKLHSKQFWTIIPRFSIPRNRSSETDGSTHKKTSEDFEQEQSQKDSHRSLEKTL